MEKKIVQKKPYVMELEAGTYWWCSCGNSKKHPFCDGSHKGTRFVPVKLVVEEKKKVVLCGCSHTQKPPFCDGSHNNL